MQRTGSIMTALFFIFLLGLSASAAEKTLGFYKTVFEREMTRIEEGDRASRKKALSTYGKNLDEAKAALQNKGDLDGTIAANDEIKRFEKEKAVPYSTPDGYPPLLVSTQKEYQSARLLVDRGTSKNTLDLIRRYLVPLEGLKKGLVQRGQIVEAQKVAAEIKRVTFISGAIAAAQPAEDPSPIKPPEAPSTRLSASLRKDLVLHYSFDKDQGEKVTDKSGTKNHGTVQGAQWIANGKVGGAYEFDGVNDRIEILPESDVSAVGDFSVSAWTFAKTRHQQPGNARQFIFNSHTDPTSGAYFAGFSLVYDFKNGTSEILNGAASGNPHPYTEMKTMMDVSGKWHHIVFIRKGRDFFSYCDGNLLDARFTQRALNDEPLNMSHMWCIGSLTGNNTPKHRSTNYSFKGTIDEVMIFNRALSKMEVKAIYSSQE